MEDFDQIHAKSFILVKYGNYYYAQFIGTKHNKLQMNLK